ncbi:hypothetical protein L2D14_12375 [Thalassospiraceae bacterium LMO-JJ14]|nr:hypothetical protein L2D14_12375 [Thalassospiraceae bacterium LMO-JJ14]
MAQKKSKGKGARFQVFNVTYEDGTLSSNRRVASEQLDQTFGEDLLELARKAIEAQDNEIAERSKQRPVRIKTVSAA